MPNPLRYRHIRPPSLPPLTVEHVEGRVVAVGCQISEEVLQLDLDLEAVVVLAHFEQPISESAPQTAEGPGTVACFGPVLLRGGANRSRSWIGLCRGEAAAVAACLLCKPTPTDTQTHRQTDTQKSRSESRRRSIPCTDRSTARLLASFRGTGYPR